MSRVVYLLTNEHGTKWDILLIFATREAAERVKATYEEGPPIPDSTVRYSIEEWTVHE